nr:hypothetical protein [Desulforamulus aquiferis]
MAQLEKEFNTRAHRGAKKVVKLVPAALGSRSGLMGAVALARRLR